MKNLRHILLLTIIFSCVSEETSDYTIVYNKGELEHVEIRLFKSNFTEPRSYTASRIIVLNENLNQVVFYAEGELAPGFPDAIEADSLVIVLNENRFIASAVRGDPNPLFQTTFYERPQPNFLIKTFTQEDYDNAEPF